MLRAPIGKYNVGISNIDTEEFGDGKFRRKLSLLLFYPSDETGMECPYMDAEYQKTEYLKNEYQKKVISGYYDNGVRTYCYRDVKLSQREDSYPVVIYNHGLNGFQMESTVLCADIASSGYVVVSIGHPYGSAAVTYEDGSFMALNDSYEDGSFLNLNYSYGMNRNNLASLGELWYEDIRYAVKYIDILNHENAVNRNISLYGRIDTDEGINLLGVSFGGCCSVGAALSEKKIRCAINLDGGLFADIDCVYRDKPIMVMCSPMNFKAHVKLDELGCTDVTVKKIRKLSHWEFSDGVYFSKRGRADRNRADTISMRRAILCLEFLRQLYVQ